MPDQPFALSVVSPQPAAEGEYDAICATMMQSARGRWFLDEYARRNRSADTAVVLSAIERIETVIRSEMGRQPYQSFRGELLEMAKAITLTRAEVAAIRPEGQGQSEVAGPDARSAPASPLLVAAERIADVAWTMRERGFDPRTCEQIEGLASSILATPFLRDTDDRRAHQLSEVLAHLERRINVMLGAVAPAGRAEEEKDAEPKTASKSMSTAASDARETIDPAADEPRDIRQSNDAFEAPASGQDAATDAVLTDASASPAVADEPAPHPVPEVSDTPTESEVTSDAVAAHETESADPPDIPPSPLETIGDIPAGETESAGPSAPELSRTIPMSEVEPADFLLEPMRLRVGWASPVQPAPVAASETPAAASSLEVISEPDEELFVPAEQAEVERSTVATVEPAARPTIRDPLAALRAMSNAERIALFT
jgi:hypothetical protein